MGCCAKNTKNHKVLSIISLHLYHMKRLSTLLILFLIPYFVFSQKTIRGMYCSPTDFVGYCINFINDSSFHYETWSCMQNSRGNGIYEISSHKLILRFDSSESKLDNSHSIQIAPYSNEDSVYIQFHVIDKDSNALVFAQVIISDGEYRKANSSIITGSPIDTNGNASFVFAKENKTIWVEVSFIGYYHYSFELSLDSCQNIEVYLRERSFNSKIEGEVYSYRIKSFGENKIVVKQKGGRGKVVLKKK